METQLHEGKGKFSDSQLGLATDNDSKILSFYHFVKLL